MVDNSLGLMCNTARTLVIKAKEYTAKELTLEQISKIRRELLDNAKKEWINELQDLLSLMDKKDHPKFLLEARQGKKFDDAYADQLLQSTEGITKVICASLNITPQEFYAIRNCKEVEEVFMVAFGIEDVIKEANDKSEVANEEVEVMGAEGEEKKV